MAFNRRNEGINNIGQRRNPPIGNNFVPGGQLTPQQNRQQANQQGAGQRPGLQNQANGNFRPQQGGPQRGPPPQQQQQPQQQQFRPQAAAAPPRPVQQPPPQAPPAENLKAEPGNKEEKIEEGSGNKKPSWTHRVGKVSRKERQRRRNLRLSKMLQPKNAVMILNELVKSAAYTIQEAPPPNNHQYMASVFVEEVTHVGYGNSKSEAKNSAAEAAIKHIVKNRKLTPQPLKPPQQQQQQQQQQDEDGDEKMVVDDDANLLPWQHVASFALYKLLNSWGEDPFQARNQAQTSPDTSIVSAPQNKPAKKMPENAAHINPLMVMNQMLPQVQFEELEKVGDPPNIVFTFRCTVNGQTFTGSGSNKKTAKKMTAFAVCNKVLEIQYPPEVYTPVA